MHTNELLRQIDDSMELGRMILEGRTADAADKMEELSEIERFCREIRMLTEEVYGRGSRLPGSFEASSGCEPELLEEGMKVLRDLRIMVEYSGEFSS